MEIPELLRRWCRAAGIMILCGISFPITVFEYEVSTHAALTQAIFNEYNTRFKDAGIPEEYRFALVQGAEDEDAGTRFMNHFHDPSTGRGLRWAGREWPSAKRWATDAKAQGNEHFTLNDAVEAYAAGDEERAFRILGHVLHLLEDMGVPEHVRNDPHGIESPYESFTRLLVPAAPSKPPIELGSLGAHFDALAKYAQENFYSADTIDGDYAVPKPDYFKREGPYEYAFKTADGERYHLARIVSDWPNGGDGEMKNLSLKESFGEKKILSDYWRLLSGRTIRHGAGLVRLFMNEAQTARAAALVRPRDAERKTVRAHIASAVDSLLPSFVPGSDDDEWAGVEEIPLDDSSTGSRTSSRKSGRAGEESQKPVSGPTAASSGTGSAAKPAPVVACIYGSGTLSRGSVIINEIAWMGSSVSANAEWIELKNTGTIAIDISEWQIISRRGRVHIVIDDGEAIPAGGFYLMERTSDNSVPGAVADHIYAGALSNTDDGLRLFDSHCVPKDEVAADPSWPAGNAPERRTMERAQDFSWHDYSGNAARAVFGTPKKENGIPPAPKVAVSASTAVGGSQSPSGTASAPASSGSSGSSGSQASSGGSAGVPSSSSVAVSISVPVAKREIVVNEFLFDAAGSDTGHEFIELYNTGSRAISFDGWSIQTQSAKKNFEAGSQIPAGGCFLVALGSSASEPTFGMRWASGSLNNTEGAIYLARDEEYVAGDGDPDIIDVLRYAKASFASFVPGMSLERDHAGTLHLRPVPNPGDCARSASSASVSGSASASNASSASVMSSSSSSGGATTGDHSGEFLQSAYFYEHPQGTGSLIDIHWDTYPFISGSTDAWKALVFYANSAPGEESQLHTDSGWEVADESALTVRYPIYSPGATPPRRVLILPDTKARSDSGGGLENAAYNYDYLIEDRMARMETDFVGKSGDYITIGYYDFFRSGGGDQQLNLVYADPKKYYFNDPKAPLAIPRMGDAAYILDPLAGIGSIVMPQATDSTSLDHLISFSIANDLGIELAGYRAGGSFSFLVALGEDFDFTLEAKNNFGITSVPAQVSGGSPGVVRWALVQGEAGATSRLIGKLDTNCSSCPPSASLEKISFAEDTEINAVTVRLVSDKGIVSADLRLRAYPDMGGMPNLSLPIAEKVIRPRGVPLPTPQDASFIFDAPFVLRKNVPYWLALEVADYPNSADWFSPHVRNALSSGDAYPDGAYQSDAGKDWYMKIGLWEP